MSTRPQTQRRTQKAALNLTDLLSFTLPPRQTHHVSNLPRRSRRPVAQQGFWIKERFVNAQYRFIMNPNGDYTVHFADPDIPFQWEDIMQILIPRSSALASAAGDETASVEGSTACPICLAAPTAPRMTKCGHVYCYPCILHYLNTTDAKWVRCPICFDSINEKQLKSVKVVDPPTEVEPEAASVPESSASAASLPADLPTLGSTMRMRLMQRPQNTTLALPRSTTWPSDVVPLHQAPYHFMPDVFQFAKFMLATPAYLIADLTKDLDELALERRTLASMHDSLGLSFVDAAETRVQDQLSRASELENPMLKDKIDRAYRDLRDIEGRAAYHANRAKELAQQVKDAQAGAELPAELVSIAQPPAPPRVPTGRNNKQRRNLNPPPPPTSTYFYYQAASGLPLFLHPLDIKILLSHFHSYSSFPDSLSVRIDAFSEGSVNEDLRKRCKYLAHVPEGADVIFVEADLEAAVGKDALKPFEQALKMRSTRRKEKDKKDDRAKIRAEELERERLDLDTLNAGYWNTQLPPPQPARGDVIIEPQPAALSSSPGAWGDRSFASALHSTSAGPRPPPRTQRDIEDEWDVDAAWHEMEARAGSGGGGRKKRNTKMVVLGSGGGGRRR